MAARVLVVDDSGFFRRRVCEIINADPLLEVVGTAANGAEAIEQAAKLKPDVITMDIEMPVMDGIAATRRIMAATPTPIIMFSSLTTEGATATLEALEAGAVDFLPKRFEDISKDREEAKRLLCQRVRSLLRSKRSLPSAASKTVARAGVAAAPRAVPKPTIAPAGGPVKLVAIGTSTGGPVALQQVLSGLSGQFPVPLVLVQHMPAAFTGAFAKRLDQQCAISVKEASDGDELQAATAYLAPGGMQMTLEGTSSRPVLRISDSEPGQTYKPSVDKTFSSIARLFPKTTLAIVLTGMGADGREGTRLLKQGGSTVWAQDEESCVVYGMPAAVAEAGLVDKVYSLSEIGPNLAKRV